MIDIKDIVNQSPRVSSDFDWFLDPLSFGAHGAFNPALVVQYNMITAVYAYVSWCTSIFTATIIMADSATPSIRVLSFKKNQSSAWDNEEPWIINQIIFHNILERYLQPKAILSSTTAAREIDKFFSLTGNVPRWIKRRTGIFSFRDEGVVTLCSSLLAEQIRSIPLERSA